MFGNKNTLQAIVLEDCPIQLPVISNSIVISGKNYYAPKFENSEITNVELYFRVKYKKTKAAVSRDRIPFEELLEKSGFYKDKKIDLVNIIDHAKYVHVENCGHTNKYIIHFCDGKIDDSTTGYFVFNAPNTKEQDKVKFSKYEMKLIKYFKKLLDI